MSFIKKTLASLGLGSAKVDSILHTEPLTPGEPVKISVHVYGGSTSQAIDHIDLKLCCFYVEEIEHREPQTQAQFKHKETRTHVLDSWSLPYSFTIEPGEQRDFEIELDVPWNTPVTIGDSKVWLETGLDIARAIDPTDKDLLTVKPDPLLDSVFSVLEKQGLRIRQAECEAAKGFTLPFIQEFEFVPTTGPFHGVWRELEIVAYRDEEQLQLWFEVDRQMKGFSGLLSSLLGTDELKSSLTLDAGLPAEEVGNKVVDYLTSLT